MDIVALEFLCCVASAYDQLDRGTDFELLTQVTENLRALEPQHHLLPELERKIARLAEQASDKATNSEQPRRLTVHLVSNYTRRDLR